MEITWYGNSCFQIKGSDATVVADAYTDTKVSKLKANILVLGDEAAQEKGNVAELEENPRIIDWPGEFEVSGVSIESYPAHAYSKSEVLKNQNVFVFTIDGFRVCTLSSLNHDVSDDLLDKLGEVDVLIIPVGGKNVLDTKTAQTIIEEIDPRIIVPSCFESPAEFLKANGKTDLQTVPKLVVKGKSELMQDGAQIVLLENLNG